MARIYILRSLRGQFYIGSTVNLQQSLRHHERKWTPSTKCLGDMILVFPQQYATIQEARNIGSRLKRLKRKDYIEKIIRDQKIKLRA